MIKKIAGVFSSNALGAGLGFLFNLMLARSCSVADYGEVMYFYTLLIVFVTVLDLGFANTIVVYPNKVGNGQIKETMHSIIVFFNRYLIFIAPLLLILLIGFRNLIGITLEISFLLFTGTVLFLVYRINTSYQQGAGQWGKYNLLNIFNNLSKIGLFILFYLFWGSNIEYSSVVYIYVISSAILLLISWKFKDKAISRQKLQWSKLKTTLIPFALLNSITILGVRLDIIFTKFFFTEHEIGIYAAANTLALIFPVFSNALMSVLLKFSAENSENITYFRQMFRHLKKLVPIVIILVLIAVFSVDFILPFFFGEKYNQAIPIFKILIVAFSGSIFILPLESLLLAKAEKQIVILRFIQVPLQFIVTYALKDYLGLYSIALGAFVARFFGWGIVVFLINKLYNKIKK
ncbi:oligosaccharide flippase family protein [Marinifilum sp.]|uniref:oligosaccharide flippase family protein n=1 Tax=Marinifilum sp. TaxID=2033137 RepID=UPI003BAA6DCE